MLNSLQQIKTTLEKQIKQKDEDLKLIESTLKKKNAILTQNIEFKELELKDAREQLIEQKRSHENILNAFENTMSNESA